MNRREKKNYRAQVRELRRVARSILFEFSRSHDKLELLNHGENTTFKTQAKIGRRRLTVVVRLHRNDYHTTSKINGELKWLDWLRGHSTLPVPRPLKSKNGRFIETVGDKRGAVFEFIPGRFKFSGLTGNDLFSVGKMTAKLHRLSQGPGVPRVHRPHWDKAGLLGPHRIWKGDIRLLPLSSRQRRQVEVARKKLARVLSRCAKSKKNFGLIHADLHTGNFFFLPSRQSAVIDFDDCGYGYYMYDLAVTIAGLRTHPRRRLLIEKLKDGYAASGLPINEELLRALIGVRYYLILNWFASRLENPRLRARARKIAPKMFENLMRFS